MLRVSELVPVLPCQRHVTNPGIRKDLGTPFHKRSVPVQFIPDLASHRHRELIVRGILRKILAEIMGHVHVVSDLLGPVNALLHFVRESVPRDRPPGREIDSAGPGKIRELIHRRHLAPGKTRAANGRGNKVLISHRTDQLEHGVLLLNDRLKNRSPAVRDRF